jgi:hypothetical protein
MEDTDYNKLNEWLLDQTELSDDKLIDEGFELFFKTSFPEKMSDEEAQQILLML